MRVLFLAVATPGQRKERGVHPPQARGEPRLRLMRSKYRVPSQPLSLTLRFQRAPATLNLGIPTWVPDTVGLHGPAGSLPVTHYRQFTIPGSLRRLTRSVRFCQLTSYPLLLTRARAAALLLFSPRVPASLERAAVSLTCSLHHRRRDWLAEASAKIARRRRVEWRRRH